MILSAAIFFSYLSYVQCANILGVFMVPSLSHQIVYQPIWKQLSLRGHNVTVVTPRPLNDSTLTNLTEISLPGIYGPTEGKHILETIFKDRSIFQTLSLSLRFIDDAAEAVLNNTQFKQLIADQSRQFDLILMECYHPVMYALAFRFKAPHICVSSADALTTGYDIVGNPTHPVLYPDVVLSVHDKELSVWQKLKNIFFSLCTRYYHHNFRVPRAHELAKKYFGNDIPYVGEIEMNVSMFFLNVNPIMSTPRPNVPAIVEIGQMHIKPAKPLPQDLEAFLDQAKEGVIYLSLGSSIKSTDIPEEKRKTITEALSELPYKVIWKWESDNFPEKPPNVITKKWLPQQDVLAHPNIKAFVTQGGLQSMEEAISRGVPLVGMPFIADQPRNVQGIINLRIGLGVYPVTVSKDELKNCIIEVVKNTSYKNRIKEIRDLLFDTQKTGLEQAMWWSEYVIRHRGARHLRSPTANISWIQYLMLDVVSIIFLMPGIAIYLCYKVAKSHYFLIRP